MARAHRGGVDARGLWLVAGFALAAFGCADNGTPQCAVGADCASGACRADGTCVPVAEDAAAPMVDAAPADLGSRADASVVDAGTRDGAAPVDGGGLCVPTRDGVIQRDEVPLRAGLRATFRVATDVAFDTAGEPLAGDRRRWDMTGPFEGDTDVLVATQDPSGSWYADDFPGATYVTGLAADNDLLGVFEVTPSALELMGVVSPDDGFTRTNLENDPAVAALRFPLALGDRWSVDTDVSGVANGAVVVYDETYESEVDRAGELITPFGSFEVLRVRTELTRVVGFVTTRIVSFAFVSECFGTVATVRGDDDDTGSELSMAAELRRLVP